MRTVLESPPALTSVLTAAYRRLTGVCEALDVEVADPGTAARRHTFSADELTSDQRTLDAFVDAEAARIRTRHGHTPRPHVAASRALHDYAWSIALLMSGVWYLERRVPRVRPQSVRLDLATGTYTITPEPRVACLPGDPVAALPGAVAIADEEALRAELRAAIADHMRPLLTALGPAVRRGPRALWGMVGDDLVSGVWYLGRTLGREGDAVRAATALLPEPVGPYPAGADFRLLAGTDGRHHPTRTRTGCCLYYAIRPDEACATCPRTCDAERLRRLES
ncbi:(2Fe-2S)-binding protein [Streptomyces afghaniensis]|uniref:(2Fe-2S)-binding protein n=1 Tax=Streptomyces afghaniensis TaxID=66865 RepID=UPI0037AF9451